MKTRRLVMLLAGSLLSAAQAATIQPLTVASYASFADSPFSGLTGTLGYFHLEDAEDGAIDTPGLSAVSNTPGTTLGVYAPGPYTDSVDGDDGAIDGSGLAGHSIAVLENTGSEDLGYTFSFDAAVLGSLPTHVGIVWTDGALNPIDVVFEAFDAAGNLLATVTATTIGDRTWSGATAEDLFLGVISDVGVQSFTLRVPGGSNNLEVDHIQYGGGTAAAGVPEPALPLLLAAGGLLLAGTAGLRRRSSLRA